MLFHEVDKNGHKHCTISLDTLLVVQSTGTRSQIGGLNSTTKTSSGLRKRVCPCHVRPPFLTTKVQSQDTHQRFEEVVLLDQERSVLLSNKRIQGRVNRTRANHQEAILSSSLDLHSDIRLLAPLILPWLQVLLTLFHKCFSHFSRPTCSLSVSCQYLGLRGIHLASSNNMLKLFYSLSSTESIKVINILTELQQSFSTRLSLAFGVSFQISQYNSRRRSLFVSVLSSPYRPQQQQDVLTLVSLKKDLRFAKWFRDSHYGLFNRLY